MDSKLPWNCFSKLQTSSELSCYLTREYEHSKYIHYTKLEVIDSILKSCEFWVSDVRELNDRKDREQFDGTAYFTLCFSTGVNENLPLWYLYSGIDGKGGSIIFTKAKIKKLIQEGKYELWEFENNNKLRKVCDIKNGENAEISFVDVLYANKDIETKQRKPQNVALKYNTMTNYNITNEEFEVFKKTHCGNIKGLIWYYEKETRLLVRLDDELSAKINYKDNPRKYKIVLNFSHLTWKEFKISLAPGVIDYSEVEDCEMLKKYRNESSGVSLSLYKGDVDFKLQDKLCGSCKKRKDDNK